MKITLLRHWRFNCITKNSYTCLEVYLSMTHLRFCFFQVNFINNLLAYLSKDPISINVQRHCRKPNKKSLPLNSYVSETSSINNWVALIRWENTENQRLQVENSFVVKEEMVGQCSTVHWLKVHLLHNKRSSTHIATLQKCSPERATPLSTIWEPMSQKPIIFVCIINHGKIKPK